MEIVVLRSTRGRRAAATVVAGAALVAGCSGKSKSAAPPSSSGPVAIGSQASSSATVSGAFGSLPTIKPIGSKPVITQVSVLSRGTGAPLKLGDLAIVDDYGRTWRSSAAFQNTFTTAVAPDTLPIGSGALQLPGLDKALLGVPTGSRVLVILPPDAGFGKVTTTLPTGVKKTDTALLVFDVHASFASNAGPTGATVSSGGGALPTVSGGLSAKPVLSMPKSAPPTALSSTTLVQGTGPATVAGDELVVQYLGQIWASGKEFDSSWSRDTPTAFTVGVGDLIPAWDKALVGVKVGSRVLLVVPPADGYGSAGQAKAGISGTDTLVYVLDVLGAFKD